MGSPGLYTSSSSSPFLLLFFSFLAFLDFLASLACLFLLLVLAHSFLPPLPLFSLLSSIPSIFGILTPPCSSSPLHFVRVYRSTLLLLLLLLMIVVVVVVLPRQAYMYTRGINSRTPRKNRGNVITTLSFARSCSADPRARTPPGEEEPPSSLTTRHTSLVSAVYEIFIGIFRWPGDSHFRGNRGGNDRFAYAIYDFDRETNRERRWAWVGADVSTDDSSLD